MTYDDYANLAAEMIILLRYIDDELVEKIPQKIIEFFQDIASPNFKSKIDPRFPLDEQYLLPSTECMLTLLYRQYWCTPEEREELDQMLIASTEGTSSNIQLNDNIFDKIENSEDIFVEDTNSNLPSNITQNTFIEKIQKILDYLTEIFKKLFNK